MAKSEKNISRRNALKYAGAGALAIAAGIAGYELGTSAPPPATTGTATATVTAPTVTAPATGAMTLAWWAGPELDALNPAFAEYRKQMNEEVAVVIHSGGSANIIPKIAAAWPRVYIDSTGVNGNGVYALADQGFTIPIDASAIPSMGEYDPKSYVTYKGKAYGMYFATNSCVLVYRADKVTEPMTSLADMMRPELKGRVGIGEPTVAAASYLLAWALQNGGSETNIDPAFSILKQLGEMGNIGLIWADEPVALNALASGEVWALQYCDYGTGGYLAPNLNQYPWAKIVKNPAAGKAVFWGDAFTIVNGPRQDKAKKFFDIMLRQDIQAQFAPVNGMPSTHPKVGVDPKLAPWVNTAAELAQYGYVPDLAAVVKDWSAWKARFDKEIRPLVKA